MQTAVSPLHGHDVVSDDSEEFSRSADASDLCRWIFSQVLVEAGPVGAVLENRIQLVHTTPVVYDRAELGVDAGDDEGLVFFLSRSFFLEDVAHEEQGHAHCDGGRRNGAKPPTLGGHANLRSVWVMSGCLRPEASILQALVEDLAHDVVEALGAALVEEAEDRQGRRHQSFLKEHVLDGLQFDDLGEGSHGWPGFVLAAGPNEVSRVEGRLDVSHSDQELFFETRRGAVGIDIAALDAHDLRDPAAECVFGVADAEEVTRGVDADALVVQHFHEGAVVL